jgi:hypothetical protein
LEPRRREFELSNPEQEKSTSKPNDDIIPFANLNRCFKQNRAQTANSSVWASPVHSVRNCLVNVVRKECHRGVVSISRFASRNGQRRFYNLRTFLLRIRSIETAIVSAIRFSFFRTFRFVTATAKPKPSRGSNRKPTEFEPQKEMPRAASQSILPNTT